jgi:hypothetical protein
MGLAKPDGPRIQTKKQSKISIFNDLRAKPARLEVSSQYGSSAALTSVNTDTFRRSTRTFVQEKPSYA